MKKKIIVLLFILFFYGLAEAQENSAAPIISITALNNIIKTAPQELAKNIDKYIAENIIDLNTDTGKFLYAYSLAKTENYRKYAEELVKIKAVIKRFSETQITEFENFLDEFKIQAEKNNTVIDALVEQIYEDINARKQIFNPNLKQKTLRADLQKLSLFVDWFSYNENEVPLLRTVNARELLKEHIERSFLNSGAYEININSQFKVEGQIKSFVIKNDRFNSANEVTEKRVELLVDFRILESTANQIINEKKNYYFEYSYYTPAFGGLGISDAEGLINFSEEASKKIFEELESRFSDIRKQLSAGKKAVELSSTQKDLLKSMLPPPPAPPPPFSGSIILNNEDIRVSGALESSGESKKHYNKFDGNADLKFNFKALNGDVGSFVKLKGSNLSDNREFELDKITVDYKNKNFSLSAGNIFPFMSKMVFNNAQEGVMLEYKPEKTENSIKFFAGRDRRAEDYVNFHTLNLGFSFTSVINKLSNGSFNFVYTKDDPSSILYDSTVMLPGQNSIISYTGKFTLEKLKELSFNYEFAYSYYKNLLLDTDNLIGNAIDFKTAYTAQKNIFNFAYTWTAPDFVTLYGNAAVDRQKFDFTYTNKMIENMILKFNGIYQNDNLEKENEKTNYVNSYTANMNYQPFVANERPLMKTIKMESSYEIRNTYNKILNKQLRRDKYNQNLLFKVKLMNTFFSNSMNAYISYENENDEDRIEFVNSKVKQYECANGYTKKIFDAYNLDLRGRYRYKTVDEKIDKLFNGSGSLRYTKDAISCLLSYYYDLTLTTVADQDSAKHKIEAEFNYLKNIKKIRNNYIFKITYDINDFENKDLNFKKLSAFTGYKMEF